MSSNTYKKLINEMVDKIEDDDLLKRIYDLVSYIYLRKVGK